MIYHSSEKFGDGLEGKRAAGIRVLKTIEPSEGLRRLFLDANRLMAFLEIFDAVERAQSMERKLVIAHG